MDKTPLTVMLRSALFSIVMVMVTIFYASLSLFTFPLAPHLRYRFITQWSRFIIWWLAISCNIHYQVIGRGNIPTQNCIILSNHQSTWETLALQLIFPKQTWVIKRELLWVPFFGWALALLKPIAIDRHAGNKALSQLLEQGTQRLQQGYWIIVFPEGTRIAYGKQGRFGRGGVALAKASSHPIIPVAHNAGKFWPRRGFIKYPGTIQIIIGPVINSQDQTIEQIREQAKQWIEQTLTTL